MSKQHVDHEDRDGNVAHIACTRAGRGVPVVLIHGVGLQGAIWQPQAAALQPGHDAATYGQSGLGREGGLGSVLDYTRTKLVWVRATDEPIPDPFVTR